MQNELVIPNAIEALPDINIQWAEKEIVPVREWGTNRIIKKQRFTIGLSSARSEIHKRIDNLVKEGVIVSAEITVTHDSPFEYVIKTALLDI